MYKQEQIKPYEGEGEKGKLVEEMFDNIAPTYDTLNHRLSWDIDKGWRRKAIGLLQRHYPEKMLDIATGTGDFAILAAKMLHPQQLIGADISEGMMEIGRQKVKKENLQHIISFKKEDCTALTLPSNSFDLLPRRNLRCSDGSIRHTQFPKPRPGTQGNVPSTEEGRTSEHRRTHTSREIPDEAALPHLFPHGIADIRQADL